MSFELKPVQSDFELADPETIARGLAEAVAITKFEREVARIEAEKWHYKATHDSLTGVLNPAGIKELTDAYDAAGIELFVLFGDGFRFGEINKKQGHAAGNKAIIGMAETLTQSVRQSPNRPSDHIGRYGGDEFVIFGPARGMSADDLDLLRDRIELNINRFTDDHPEFSGLGISTGCAIASEGMQFEDTRLIADAEMQTHKAITRAELV